MPAVPLLPARTTLLAIRLIGHTVTFEDARTCLMNGYRLMSDYEVTLVNDNSMDPSITIFRMR